MLNARSRINYRIKERLDDVIEEEERSGNFKSSRNMRIAPRDDSKVLFSEESNGTRVRRSSFIDVPLLERCETKKVGNSEWRKESAKPQRE